MITPAAVIASADHEVTIRLIAANAIAEAFEASFAALNALLLWGKPIKRYPIYALH